MKMIWLKWRDASEETGEWMSPVEANPKGKEALIETAGIFVKESDGFVTLALDWCDGHVRNVGHVPKSWVIDRKEWDIG